MASNTTTQNIVQQTQLPDWYVNYLSPLMQRAVGLTNTPYQQYTGPRVAPLNAQQQQAYDLTQSTVGSQTPYIQQALDYTNQAANTNSGAAGAGSYADASGIFNNVANSSAAGISSPYVGQGTDYLSQAAQGSSLGAANPYIQQSTAPTGMNAAAPYLGAAAQTFPQAAADYMSPYTSAVTDRIAQLGARNLQENLLPTISDQFVRSGQYGSPQQRDFMGRALRDENESVLGQQAQALEQGYGTAGQLFGQDQSRLAGLAGTAGSLGTSQQQILQGAGSTTGNLSATDLSRLAAAGVNIGNLGIGQAGVAGADYSRQLGAGQGLEGIGQSQIQASQNDAARQMQAGQQTMDLSKYGLSSTLQTADALNAAGNQQQGQTQANYNQAYQDYLTQLNYPWQQIGQASNVLQGVPINTSSTQQSQTTQPAPSTTSQIAGIGLGVAGLANSGIFGHAKGGAVKGKQVKYKRAHSYGNVPKRGLAFMEAA